MHFNFNLLDSFMQYNSNFFLNDNQLFVLTSSVNVLCVLPRGSNVHYDIQVEVVQFHYDISF